VVSLGLGKKGTATTKDRDDIPKLNPSMGNEKTGECFWDWPKEKGVGT